MSGVALRERDSLGYPIPLDALCLGHADLVTDSSKRPIRGAAALLVAQRFVISRFAVRHLAQQVTIGLGDCLRHREGAVSEDLDERLLVDGHALT
jgi:hypothetical protein